MVEMVSSKSTNLAEDERVALIAIRKELLRKNMTITRLFKDLNKLDRYIHLVENEND